MVGGRVGRGGGSKSKGRGGGIRKRKSGRASAKKSAQRLAKFSRLKPAGEVIGGATDSPQQAVSEICAQPGRIEVEDVGCMLDDSDSEPEAVDVAPGTAEIPYCSLVSRLQPRHDVVPVASSICTAKVPFCTENNVEISPESEPAEQMRDQGFSITQDLSGEAATREQRHFGSICLPGERHEFPAKYDYSPTVLIPKTARVSIAPSPPEGAEHFFSSIPLDSSGVNCIGLQPSVLERWRARDDCALDASATMAPREALLANSLRTFHDVLFCQPCSPLQERRVREIVVAHALSHVLRCRSRVVRNDAKLRAAGPAPVSQSASNVKSEEDFRDQGFARPRILILAPMRNDAYDIVTFISKLAVGTGDGVRSVAQIGNRDRFEEEFAPRHADDGGSAGEGNGSTGEKLEKPGDWQHRFRGNVDDDFKLGISLTKKSVKLFSDFYQSDIIVASPLGLVRSMEVKRAAAGGKAFSSSIVKSRRKAVDDWTSASAKLTPIATKKNFAEDDEADDDGFLSSIEVCIVDGASTFKMQNWNLLLTTLRRVNNMPSRPRDSDFARIRPWALNQQMRLFRQTIVLTDQKQADVFSLFRSFENWAGRIRLYAPSIRSGSISDVVLSIRQRFLRVEEVRDPVGAPDRHFEEFMMHILPELRSSVDCQALVVVPSYFDFVRVRNALVDLEEREVSFHFASLSEYSKESDVARAKTRFFTGKVKILVITERVHFYWRSSVRGANTVVWYSAPECGRFYSEIVNTMAEAADRGRRVQSILLFNEYDFFALERIVGTSRSKKMTSPSARNAFLFT